MSVVEKLKTAGAIAILAVFLIGWSMVGIDHMLHPEKAAAEREAEAAEKKAEEATIAADTAQRAAVARAKEAEAHRLGVAERELQNSIDALQEARSHYPQTDADILEYQRYWQPREVAARQRYEAAVLAARRRTAKEVEDDAAAWLRATDPYLKGR